VSRGASSLRIETRICGLLLGVATLAGAGCATHQKAEVSAIQFAADPDNHLDSRPLKAACAIGDDGFLRGRGAAGGLSGIGTVSAGTYVFNRMLMGLSPAIAMVDKYALDQKIQHVLEQDSDGRQIEWIAPNSGESVVLKPTGTHSSFRLVTVPRAEEVGRTPESFRLERGSFITLRESTLRPSPTIAGDVAIQDVPPGRTLEVYGRVRGMYGENWYMVGNDGRAYGYMEPAGLKPHEGEQATRFHRITGPTLRDPVNATVPCRDLTFSTANGEESVQSCRGPEGVWFTDMPVGSAEGRVACLPVARAKSFR